MRPFNTNKIIAPIRLGEPPTQNHVGGFLILSSLPRERVVLAIIDTLIIILRLWCPKAMEPLPTPVKGKADWREYRAFKLENGVTCLIIQDKESKTTAMSCVVNAGAAADPRTLSGLAHFCEHMW